MVGRMRVWCAALAAAVAAGVGAAPAALACVSDKQCGAGERCVAGGCLKPPSALDPPARVYLRSGAEVPALIVSSAPDLSALDPQGNLLRWSWSDVLQVVLRDGKELPRPAAAVPAAPAAAPSPKPAAPAGAPAPAAAPLAPAPDSSACKGGRVLVNGACVDPGASAPAAAPAASASAESPLAAAMSKKAAAEAAASAPEASLFGRKRSVVEPSREGAGVTVRTTLDSDKVRQNWLKRGGVIFSGAANFNASVLYYDKNGIKMTGAGGGGGVRLGLMALSAPDLAAGKGSFLALRIGGGLDVAAMGTTTTFTVLGRTQTNSSGYGTMTIPGYVGVQFGGGSFDAEGKWHGFTVSAEWTPSLVIPYIDQKWQEGTFNATGFALALSPATLDSLAVEAHFRLTLFLLPPVGDLPLFLSVGIGAVWY